MIALGNAKLGKEVIISLQGPGVDIEAIEVLAAVSSRQDARAPLDAIGARSRPRNQMPKNRCPNSLRS